MTPRAMCRGVTVMGDYARITPTGGVVIDTVAWIAARTEGVRADLTGHLHGWARHRHAATATSQKDWLRLASAWCTSAGHQATEQALIVHGRTRLDSSVWILPATARDDVERPDARPIAVIGIGDSPPSVYNDATDDPWEWCDADTVTIVCPANGHWWRWRSGRELLTSTGQSATLTRVFGPSLDAPFSSCPQCADYHLGVRPSPCGCDGTPWIICPVCRGRCQLGPPRP
ncbi:MAG: hypothetical protein QG597_3882 [Actinomycetota bacterium]|nr:hypothetical protein [Actinomycetota bacterium]